MRADSPVRTLAGLRGRRVAVGERLSGTLLTVSRTLAAAGVDLAGVEVSHAVLADALAALATRRVDAVCFVSGFPIRPIADFAVGTPVRVLDLGALVPSLVAEHGAQYVAGPLPASPYRLPAAVQTVSVKTHLVASPALSDDLAAGVASVIFDEQERIARLVPDVRQPTAAAGIFTEPLPLHPGALAYFRRRDRAGS
ncbi:TAXI family TRAP transporter solute-binding subunit [Nocardioides convexus]|uniref:TAXI family TRAP transporter solute-binding subunit n=1 Tax=Nocardioides convexus TaxID=2712224 RepID=UPI002418AE9D|nr:TAXI family TRAP transporter solute-binding subunit [Nocardioides convexus]